MPATDRPLTLDGKNIPGPESRADAGDYCRYQESSSKKDNGYPTRQHHTQKEESQSPPPPLDQLLDLERKNIKQPVYRPSEKTEVRASVAKPLPAKYGQVTLSPNGRSDNSDTEILKY
ncbi:hypothetical protein YA0002_25930, partial [Pseudomonas cichorii]|uniref:hypothetical protein n=1 Tax=Pseudomonas cichorii TaxID=36746 RepID=UPI0018E64229